MAPRGSGGARRVCSVGEVTWHRVEVEGENECNSRHLTA